MNGRKRYFRLTLLLTLAFLLILSGIANAGLLCRSDPIVRLSNGATLIIGADIATDQSQVKDVHYDLHVPHGVTSVAQVELDGWATTKEYFTLHDDRQANQYEIDVTVHTVNSSTAVVANMSVISSRGVSMGSFTASGRQSNVLKMFVNF